MTAPRDVKVVAYRWLRDGEAVSQWYDGTPSDRQIEAGKACADQADWTVEYAYAARALADVEAENERLRAERDNAERHAREAAAAAQSNARKVNELREALAAATARCEEVEALLVRIRDDRSWRTNDNALWPDICAALAGKGAGS